MAPLLLGPASDARRPREIPSLGLAFDQAVTITTHVACALEWLHARQVAHRDLKPENVLCASGGSRFVLADFGVVAIRCTATTGARTLCGTPEYSAPEMAEAFVANGGDPKVLRSFEMSAKHQASGIARSAASRGLDSRRAPVARWTRRVIWRP